MSSSCMMTLTFRQIINVSFHPIVLCVPSRWGHKLAEGAPGKGHGSRAFLHMLRHGAALHDASYWLALELRGSSDNLVGMLHSLW